jgi:hypothetical protein
MHLDMRYSGLLLWHPRLTVRRMRKYAKVLSNHGGQGYIWGFIDGTFRGFTRPTKKQRLAYSGHKKRHGSKWSAVLTPDELISHLAGPYLGRDNDMNMVHQSPLEEHLEWLFLTSDDQSSREDGLWLYGGQAYTSCKTILAPYASPIAGSRQEAFNDSIQKARVSIENYFGLNQNLWSTNAFYIHLKSGSMPVALYFKASVLLTNCYTCFRGNQISRKFELQSPFHWAISGPQSRKCINGTSDYSRNRFWRR